MIIGGTMLVIGWLVIFAATLYLIPQIIWLELLAYAVTLFGFGLGMVGAISYIKKERGQ